MVNISSSFRFSSADPSSLDLKNPSFVFVGRSHIINIDHVDRITTDAVYLEDGIKIQAGAETIQDVKTRIMEYWRNVE